MQPTPPPAQAAAIPDPWKAPAPFPTSAATPRLLLRFWQPSDAAAMFAAIEVDRNSFAPWLPWTALDNRTVEECAAAIERMREKRERAEPAADDFAIGVFDRATGDAIGGTGFHRCIAAAHEGEIGYWIRPDRRRQGLCAEAVAHAISWGFTPQARGGWGFRRLHIRCAASNHASRGVPQKLGLRREATLVAERWVPTYGWEDSCVWGVLASEWDCQAHRLAR